MNIRFIVDTEGPNPEHDQSDPESPHTITRPAGTEDGGPFAWIHCLPQDSIEIDPRTRKPKFGAAGPILAEPTDDECERAIARNILGCRAFKGMTREAALKKLADMVAKIKADAKKGAPAA